MKKYIDSFKTGWNLDRFAGLFVVLLSTSTIVVTGGGSSLANLIFGILLVLVLFSSIKGEQTHDY